MANANYIITPVGRLVQGDPFKPNTTDMKGKPRTDKQGNPRSEWFVALAIAKTDPGLDQFKQAISIAAQQDWPGGEWKRPDFFWKMVDGDVQEHKDKAGFAGHSVFRMTNGYPIKIYTKGGEQQIVNPDQVKRGDYFRASVSVRGNGDHTNPGIYINIHMLEHIGYGEEISGGPDAREVFGSNTVGYTPPGMSQTPVASGPGLGAPAPGIMTPQPQTVLGSAIVDAVMTGAPGPFSETSAKTPPVAGPGVPGAPDSNTPKPTPVPNPAAPQPSYDFLTPGTTATGGKPAVKMTEKAGSFTYEQFIAQGWTHERLLQEGYIKEPADFPPF
jgi:hypothetical protein